ncbi:MAG: TlpA family protein disulfide reductase [Oscillospiraceae bacterium]|nr:TlpA family protein disulfide reductase [Oscillospiraceae bacterium]
MKKPLVLLIGLVLLLAAAGVGYRYLSDRTAPAGTPVPNQTAAPAEDPAAEPESTPAAAEPESTPVAAPDFTVLSLEGEEVSLSDYRGQPVVINFWATWCPPCRSELPAFQSAWERYGDRVQFMMVDLTDGSRETEEGVRDFLEENGYSFPVYLDTEYDGAESYGVSSIPMTILVDARGNILGGQIGAVADSALLSAVADMAGE